MKKILKKNQMIITTLAVIIAVAGYVNYSGSYQSAKSKETKSVSNTAKEVSGQVQDEITDVGEAVLTNAQISNYVAKAKLEREQTHSKTQDTLEEVINDKTVKNTVKQEAVDKLSSLAEHREMETASENLLGAKGFLNSIVTISNNNVDVLVNKKELSKIERSQIEDIVMRKTGYKLDQIVITSIKSQD